MDLWRLTTVVLRRWPVTLPLLVLAGVGVWALATTTAPDYRSVAYVQLLPPQRLPGEVESATGHDNPWAHLGLHALGQTAVIAAQQPEVADALVADGLSDRYTVALDHDFPIIEIEVTAGTPEQAARTTARLTALVTAEITQRQQQVYAPSEQTIQTLVLADGSNPSPDAGSRRKMLLAAAVLGVLLTGAGGVLVDAVAVRLARRRAQRRAEPVTGEPETATAPAGAAEPDAVVEPEPDTAEPGTALEPVASSDPDAATEADVTVPDAMEPDVTAEPDAAEPVVAADPEPVAEPEPAAGADAVVEPEVAAAPDDSDVEEAVDRGAADTAGDDEGPVEAAPSVPSDPTPAGTR